MARINMTPELATQLIQRMGREYGETSTSNFALDIMVDEAQKTVLELKQRNDALEERCKRVERENEELREQLDPKRAERMQVLKERNDRRKRHESRSGTDTSNDNDSGGEGEDAGNPPTQSGEFNGLPVELG
jgi:regulator of replication initiation timing